MTTVPDDPEALEEAVDEVAQVPTTRQGKRKLLANMLRASLGIGLATFLLYRVLTHNQVDLWQQTQAAIKGLLVLAVAIQLVAIIITTYRWKWLLEVQEINVSARDLLSLTFVGMFWNAVLPGAVGGDVLKMVYITRHAPRRRAEAVLTIMVDRVMGLLGLLLVALISVLFSLDFILNANRAVQLATFTVGLGSACGILGVLGVVFRSALTRLPLVGPTLEFFRSRLPAGVVDTLDRLVRALDLYKSSPGVIGKALAISVVTHILAAITIILIGQAYHEHNVGLWNYFLAAQIANTVAAIPLTPAGFGGRDFVLSEFFKAGGAAPSEAGIIPAFNTLILLFWSLVGGVFYIMLRQPHRAPK